MVLKHYEPHARNQEDPMTRKMIRNAVLATGIAAISLTTAACNTVKGLGRDIESVGEAGDRVI